jgi:hypothetical protein
MKRYNAYMLRLVIIFLSGFQLLFSASAQNLLKNKHFPEKKYADSTFQELFPFIQSQLKTLIFDEKFRAENGNILWNFRQGKFNNKHNFIYIFPLVKDKIVTSFLITASNSGYFTYELHHKRALQGYHPEYSLYGLGMYDTERILAAFEYKCFNKLSKKMLTIRPQVNKKIIRRTGYINFGKINLYCSIKKKYGTVTKKGMGFSEAVWSNIDIPELPEIPKKAFYQFSYFDFPFQFLYSRKKKPFAAINQLKLKYSALVDGWDASYPHTMLDKQSFVFSTPDNNSICKAVIKQLNFKDSRGNRNNFILQFEIPAKISAHKMNELPDDSILEYNTLLAGSHAEYLGAYFPELFLTGQLKYERDSSGKITTYVLSEQLLQTIACWCTNRAAFYIYNFYPYNCALPGSQKILAKMTTFINSSLNIFFPGSAVNLHHPDKKFSYGIQANYIEISVNQNAVNKK